MIDDLEDLNISDLIDQLCDNTHNNTLNNSNINNSNLNKSTDLYDEMSTLKDRVLGLLQNYQGQIQKKQNARELNKKIREDAKKISGDYSMLVEILNQSADISMISNDPKQEHEINNMFDLVEEFLDKFSGEQTYVKRSKQINDSQVGSISVDSIMDTSSYNFQNVSVLESSQNSQQSSDTIKKRINEKFEGQYCQKILLESLENVLEIKNENLVSKILHQIQQDLWDDEDPMKIYQMMNDFVSKIQLEDSKKQEQQEEKKEDSATRRREFFNLALKIKSQLGGDHTGKKMLVSALFDRCQQEGILSSQWNDWILKEINK